MTLHNGYTPTQFVDARIRTTILAVASIGCLNCSHANLSDPASTTPTARAGSPNLVEYPDGPWWQTGELDNLLLSCDHILISYRGVDARPEPFSYPPTAFVPTARSQDEALRLAVELQAQLLQDPSRIGAIARQYSDDAESAHRDGWLGAFYAHEVPREFINALAELRVGEVSRVIETSRGYHILKRTAVPPKTDLSIAEILILHRESKPGWLRNDRAVPARSRDEARVLATALALQARQAPDSFEKLAERYSDGIDAMRRGDMGTWSTHEPSGAEFMVLAEAQRLPVGQISDPMESPSGFHVLRRSQAKPRSFVASEAIVIPYVGSQLGQRDSVLAGQRQKADALQFARRLQNQLRDHPERFADLRARHCQMPLDLCKEVSSYYVGRGLVPAELAIVRTKVGGLVPDPVDSPLGYLVLRRVNPNTAHKPIPVNPDLDFSHARDFLLSRSQ